MSKLLLGVSFVLITIGGYWWWGSETPEVQPQIVEETDVEETTAALDEPITREPSSSDRHVYINQNWRFSFEYSKNGWKIREPAFGSATTLFNMAIWPEEENIFDPLTINFTPKWWGDRFLERKEGDVIIGGQSGWYYQTVTMSVIPKVSNYILINNEYWINIGIQNEYLDEFQMVLDTFEFHDPLPTLDELGIKPPMPTSN